MTKIATRSSDLAITWQRDTEIVTAAPVRPVLSPSSSHPDRDALQKSLIWGLDGKPARTSVINFVWVFGQDKTSMKLTWSQIYLLWP